MNKEAQEILRKLKSIFSGCSVDIEIKDYGPDVKDRISEIILKTKEGSLSIRDAGEWHPAYTFVLNLFRDE